MLLYVVFADPLSKLNALDPSCCIILSSFSSHSFKVAFPNSLSLTISSGITYSEYLALYTCNEPDASELVSVGAFVSPSGISSGSSGPKFFQRLFNFFLITDFLRHGIAKNMIAIKTGPTSNWTHSLCHQYLPSALLISMPSW